MHIGLCYAEPLGDPGSYGLRSPGRIIGEFKCTVFPIQMYKKV